MIRDTLTKKNMNNKGSNKFLNFFNYFAILSALVLTSSYPIVVTRLISGSVSVTLLLIISLISFLLNSRYKNEINFNGLLLLLFLVTTSLITLILTTDSIYYYAIILLSLSTGYLIYLTYELKKFIEIYTKIILLIAIFSIIVFIISIIMPELIRLFPVLGERSGYTVYNLFISVAVPDTPEIKNYGIFWEPGAYQTYLSLALIFEIFFKKKKSIIFVLIYVITLLTTFSTAAYISLMLITIAYILGNVRGRILARKILVPIFSIGLAAYLIVLFTPQDYIMNVLSKLTFIFNYKDNTEFSSTVRINAIVYPFLAFIKSPIIGVGYDSFLGVAEQFIFKMPTFTFGNWFAVFGILWGIPCTLLYIHFSSYMIKTNSLSRIVVALVLVFIVSSQDFVQIAFIYSFIFYSTSRIKV